ncbi:MAG: gamma-glutamyl-gamma-aminobutyrate hydrolase family protein, partial [Spirochaetaceae bacterium]|nr:gamma-glutamyl-gamma-aminobutyrate hydrolase family protein [Spirochaetaceae bacterium]
NSETRAREGTLIHEAYKETVIHERHRHRYEFSNKYRADMIDSGLVLSAFTPDNALVESVEWPDHPWGLGVQFHPEFKSKPTAAHPLFTAFVRSTCRQDG